MCCVCATYACVAAKYTVARLKDGPGGSVGPKGSQLELQSLDLDQPCLSFQGWDGLEPQCDREKMVYHDGPGGLRKAECVELGPSSGAPFVSTTACLGAEIDLFSFDGEMIVGTIRF